jgi:hypothetical protein
MAVADILVSPVNIYYAPYGATIPDETTIDFDEAWGGTWVNLGYTVAPLTMQWDEEVFELEVEQLTNPVKGMKTKEGLVFETTLAELTAANLRLALGSTSTISTTAAGAGQKGYSQFAFGGEVNLPVYAFGFEGFTLDANNNKLPKRIFVYRASFSLGGSLEFSKRAAAGIPLKIRAWADTTQAVGAQLAIFQSVTAIATS